MSETNNPAILKVAHAEDLPQYQELCDIFFGKDHADLETVSNLHAKNPNIIELVFAGTTAIGILTMIPITAETKEHLDSENITGIQFLPKNILAPSTDATFYYLAAIGGTTPASKAVVVNELRKKVRAILSKPESIIYARPTTVDGLRIVTTLKFTAISEATIGCVFRKQKSKDQ